MLHGQDISFFANFIGRETVSSRATCQAAENFCHCLIIDISDRTVVAATWDVQQTYPDFPELVKGPYCPTPFAPPLGTWCTFLDIAWRLS